jgi:hypothetical protein
MIIPNSIPTETQLQAIINAEVVDALSVDTYPEPGQGQPPATATLIQKINYLFKWARNKHDISRDTNLERHYAADGVTVDQQRTVFDDHTVATKGAMESGA